MKPSVIFSAGACALLALTGCGTATPHAQAAPVETVTRTITVKVPGPVKTVKVTVTASPASGAAAPAPTMPSVPVFTCTVMSDMGGATGLEARVWGFGPPAYSGPVYISFSDYAGSGHLFPGLTGYMSDGLAWVPIPAADVGASAEPSQCSASS